METGVDRAQVMRILKAMESGKMSRPKPEPEELEARKVRRVEWQRFRRGYLFTQVKLADVLGVSRRTVQKVEAGTTTPLAETLRRFNALRARHENDEAA